MSHLITQGRYASMLAKANNRSGAAGVDAGPGIVTTSAVGADLIHQIPIGRSFYVTKVMWYHALAGNVLLTFGTLSNAGAPAMVQMFPVQVALPNLVGGRIEEELTGVEFMLNSVPLVGWDGNLIVTATLAGVIVAGVQITAEVAEKL